MVNEFWLCFNYNYYYRNHHYPIIIEYNRVPIGGLQGPNWKKKHFGKEEVVPHFFNIDMVAVTAVHGHS